MKAKDISDFPVQGMNKLYVNENLTQRRKGLFWLAKQKAKELDYKFVWASNGQIFIRVDKKADSYLLEPSTILTICNLTVFQRL